MSNKFLSDIEVCQINPTSATVLAIHHGGEIELKTKQNIAGGRKPKDYKAITLVEEGVKKSSKKFTEYLKVLLNSWMVGNCAYK